MSIDGNTLITGGSFTVSGSTITLTGNVKWGDVTVGTGYSRAQYEYSGGTVDTDSGDFITLGNGMTFDGAGYTIDMGDNTTCAGLFASSATSFANAPTIQNLNVINGTTSTFGGFVVRSSQKFFIVDSCSSTGTIGGDDTGGIIGRYSGLNSGECTVNQCYSTGDITGEDAGGIGGGYCGGSNGKCTITNCYATGDITGRNSGGICGIYPGHNGECIITKCYHSGAIDALYSGGIGGFGGGSNTGKLTISYCYSTGTISGNRSGGILGTSGANDGECLIYYCYSLGDITGFASGGIVGNMGGNVSLVITNCYTVGTNSGISAFEILGTASANSVAINNTYSKDGSGSNPNVVSSGSGQDANLDIDTIANVTRYKIVAIYSNLFKRLRANIDYVKCRVVLSSSLRNIN